MKLQDTIELNCGGPGSGRKPGEGTQTIDEYRNNKFHPDKVKEYNSRQRDFTSNPTQANKDRLKDAYKAMLISRNPNYVQAGGPGSGRHQESDNYTIKIGYKKLIYPKSEFTQVKHPETGEDVLQHGKSFYNMPDEKGNLTQHTHQPLVRSKDPFAKFDKW